jgi:16S rRNA (uracil1498-N3)-methyltransferase
VRVTRVHVDAPLAVGARVTLPAEASAYLVRVLRLRPGDPCVLFNGDGHDYPARVIASGKRDSEVEVLAAQPVHNESPLQILLLQGIARGEKMDWVLQKATELGVAGFVPVSSDRSEVRLDDARAAKRVAHWQGVVTAACSQCGRARVPPVAAPRPLAQALDALPGGARFLLDPTAGETIATVAGVGGACVLAVGPEGGWSAQDRGQLQAAGFEGLRLGPRILRTETAGIAAIAALQARFGDLG